MEKNVPLLYTVVNVRSERITQPKKRVALEVEALGGGDGGREAPPERKAVGLDAVSEDDASVV